MRVLVLGAAGMLGHKVYQQCRERFDVWAAARGSFGKYSFTGLYEPERFISGVDALNFDTVVAAVGQVKPQVILNCVGLVKQLREASDPILSLSINSVFPHRLAALSKASGARLIHISTDCIFSGKKGMYTEEDISDAEDLYGRSKFLGEVTESPCLTLRTSIVGREIGTAHGLLEWFLSRGEGQIQGYTKAMYSGFSTLELSRIIVDVIEHHPQLSGLYQVSSEPISKYDLLCLFRDTWGKSTTITPLEQVSVDRTLASGRFRHATGYVPPTWPVMVQDMFLDETPYDHWRELV